MLPGRDISLDVSQEARHDLTLPQEDALLSRDGHLGPRPKQRVHGPGVASQAWGALAMGYEGSGFLAREGLQLMSPRDQ